MSERFSRAEAPGLPPLEVDAGWDHPQQHFYLNVTAPGLPVEHKHVHISLYDPRNLKCEREHLFASLNLDELRAHFEKPCITPPAGPPGALADDQHRHAGNERRTW